LLRNPGSLPRTLLIGALLAGAPIVQGACAAQQPAPSTDHGLTAVQGVEVGHHTLWERPTGCTVILARDGAVGGVDVRGGAPGSRETALLDPVNTVNQVHAVVLSGGSAFGLSSADGVMRFLDERNVGFRVGDKVVPIVVGAILYDLGLEGSERVRPDASCGYEAAASASSAPVAEGSVGAGAGATVGKLLGPRRAMRGGFGTASITLPSGLTVGAAVAVNAVGDIVDPATGQLVAGARNEAGTGLVDMRRVMRGEEASAGRGPDPANDAPGMGAFANTTIGVVATNAVLTKAEATRVALMAQDGLARTTYPAHTPNDGDTVFSLATGAWSGEVDVTLVGALAADVMAEAILRAVRLAESLPGVPAARDLGR
jgi:L-aminopeptidase/D-esterase-like protein